MIYIYNGGPIAQFFWQFVYVLEHELMDRGYQVNVISELNQDLPFNDLYILFGLQEIIKEHTPWLYGRKFIIYNTEPLLSTKWFGLIPHMALAMEVWCYSHLDSQVLNFRGIKAKYFPFGYSKYFQVISSDLTKKFINKQAIFLAFHINDIRVAKLKALNNIIIVRDCWDSASYKRLVDNTFLHISLTQYDRCIYSDPCRFIPLLANKCLVISEDVQESDERLLKLFIQCKDLPELDQKINYYLQNPDAARNIIEEKYTWFVKNFSFDKLAHESGCLETLRTFEPRQFLYLDLLKQDLLSTLTIGMKRLHNIQTCFEDVLRNNIQGDLIETGFSAGETITFMAALVQFYNQNRAIFVLDSIKIRENLKQYHLLDKNIIFTNKDFSNVNKLAVLRLNSDNCHEDLERLYEKLSIGGYVIVNDYIQNQQAIDNFINKYGINCRLFDIDSIGIYWKKLGPLPV